MPLFEYTYAATAVVTIVVRAADADAGRAEALALAEAEVARAEDVLGGYGAAVALMDLEHDVIDVAELAATS